MDDARFWSIDDEYLSLLTRSRCRKTRSASKNLLKGNNPEIPDDEESSNPNEVWKLFESNGVKKRMEWAITHVAKRNMGLYMQKECKLMRILAKQKKKVRLRKAAQSISETNC